MSTKKTVTAKKVVPVNKGKKLPSKKAKVIPVKKVKPSKKQVTATVGAKPKYHKQAMAKLFTMRVTQAEIDFLKKKGGCEYVRKVTGL